MGSNDVRLRARFFFPGDNSRPDLEALKTAKVEQDESHRKLDEYIAEVIAELSRLRRQ